MSHTDLMVFIKHLAYARSNSFLNTGGIVETKPGLAPALKQPVAQDKKSSLSGRLVRYLWVRREDMARQKVPALSKEAVSAQLQ